MTEFSDVQALVAEGAKPKEPPKPRPPMITTSDGTPIPEDNAVAQQSAGVPATPGVLLRQPNDDPYAGQRCAIKGCEAPVSKRLCGLSGFKSSMPMLPPLRANDALSAQVEAALAHYQVKGQQVQEPEGVPLCEGHFWEWSRAEDRRQAEERANAPRSYPAHEINWATAVIEPGDEHGFYVRFTDEDGEHRQGFSHWQHKDVLAHMSGKRVVKAVLEKWEREMLAAKYDPVSASKYKAESEAATAKAKALMDAAIANGTAFTS